MNYLNKTKLLTAAECFTAFLTGAMAYFLIELLYRGYSHITMFFAGGTCFFLIYMCEKQTRGVNLFVRCISYSLIITSVELVFGVIFNIILGFGIWDYSDQPFNILGQVCPGFVLIWMALSFPAIFLCKKIRGLFAKVNLVKK